jgi:hypothetical protein
MKQPLSDDEPVYQKLIESARHRGDSKSIFGLLLFLERQIRSEAKDSRSQAAMRDYTNLGNRQGSAIFRSYSE